MSRRIKRKIIKIENHLLTNNQPVCIFVLYVSPYHVLMGVINQSPLIGRLSHPGSQKKFIKNLQFNPNWFLRVMKWPIPPLLINPRFPTSLLQILDNNNYSNKITKNKNKNKIKKIGKNRTSITFHGINPNIHRMENLSMRGKDLPIAELCRGG